MTPIPCPACGKECEVRPDKRGHPFLNCRDCGYNGVIARKEAVEKFKQRTGWKPDAPPPPAPKPADPPPEPKPTPEPTSWRERKAARERGQK